MDKTLTLEQVAKYPRPGMSGLKKVGFTPDGKSLTYLFSGEGSLSLQLWTYNIETGERSQITGATIGVKEGKISREEELRRERSRTREVGVTNYEFAGDKANPVLLVPVGGKLLVKQGDKPLTELENCSGAIDPHLSPDGTKVAFVRANELHVGDIKLGTVFAVTSGAEEGITNGLAEYIAQEEMGRSEGFWWSPDSRWLAYVRDDSRHIAKYPIVHQGKDEIDLEEHRYPFSGKPNSHVQLGVVPALGGETVWLDLGDDPDIYLARVAWQLDGVLTAQLLSRDQKTLTFVAFDKSTGKAQTLLTETSPHWINLNNHTRSLKSGEILRSSEKSGFCHLYLLDSRGKEIRQLTAGEWVVTEIVALDEAKRTVYFTGTKDGVTERHLYAVSLDGGETGKITTGRGWHFTTVSPEFNFFMDEYSSLDTSPTFYLRKLEGGSLQAILFHDETASPEKLGLRPPEITNFKTKDGTTLYAAIYNPPKLEAGKKYPLIVAVYGGPHAQRVMDKWDLSVDMRCQYLAQEGFVVMWVDNRGSANRGLAFEAALALNMGDIEVKDQVEGVEFIGQRAYVDKERVGVYGWSYGGFMTLMCLMRAPAVFKVGVAGAPVTHWDGYDTCYTERYMSTPELNPEGYHNGAVMTHVDNLKAKLLLVHGMVDENVHFRHTARLLSALAKAQKEYDLLIFPEERHMPREAKGLEYMERRLAAYFKQHLLGE
jgi:dipeptidyl-peptidase 4